MHDIVLTFAVCTRNRAPLLRECVLFILRSGVRLSYPWEVLVVDNGSTDETPAVLQALSSDRHLRTVREDRMGISYARNAAVRHALGRILVYIDDDVLVPPEYAERMYAAFEARKVDILGGPMLPQWEGQPPSWLTPDLYGVLGLIEGTQFVEGTNCPRIYSGNMACRRDVLAALGPTPFNTDLGRKGTQLSGGEESLLIRQLWENGARVAFEEDTPVYHRVPANRLTLRHFIKFMYDGGASDCREWQIRNGKATVSHWLIGEMIKRGAEVPMYFCLGKPTAAVASMLRFTWRLGRVVEYFKIRWLSRKADGV